VVPRIEKIFREEREKKILVIKKEIEEAEKSGGAGAGGGGGRFGANAKPAAGAARPGDINFQNMTDEEKEDEWKKRWVLPKPYEPKPEYEDRIAKTKGINTSTIHIIEGIESISKNMKADIDNQMNSICPCWKYIMLKRCWSIICIYNTTRLLFNFDDPFCKLP
jgi:hypothetical protein